MNKYTTENQNVFISLHNQDPEHKKIPCLSLAHLLYAQKPTSSHWITYYFFIRILAAFSAHNGYC